CRQCGAPLRNNRSLFCAAACRETYAQEVNRPKFEAAGTARLAELRAEGRDPSKTAEALRKVASTQQERAAARAQWEADHADETADPELFRRQVWPRLRCVSLTAMRRATSLSLSYCAQIKKGQRVPHPSYWQPLKRLTH